MIYIQNLESGKKVPECGKILVSLKILFNLDLHEPYATQIQHLLGLAPYVRTIMNHYVMQVTPLLNNEHHQT